ncbi:MAG: T9SS type A sorting domain-containing protein [Candidatus Latescibacteria bacterium]|nr:T9SS type A sorting domain-containing protein [Candidatus Latescibacterota bacterium]
MNKHKWDFDRLGGVLLLALLAVPAIVLAKDAKLVIRSLSPQEIKDYALPATTQKSSGLATVGVGEAAYLEVQVDTGTVSSGVTWTLTKPTGSTAQLADSPLGTAVPINLAERAVRVLAGRKMLIPDKTGQYTVTARVARTVGDTTLTQNVTAATYVGVGNVGGATPTFPQCATCHADKTAEWGETGHAVKLERAVNGLDSDHYAERCISCHTLGFNTAATAVNSGFDDVLKTTTWGTTAAEARGDTVGNFFKVLQDGNFAKMPAALQAKSNIQCENCHGPGSEHQGDPTKISTSLAAGDCGSCHDSLNQHWRNAEWRNSLHAKAVRSPSGPTRTACVVCHTAGGFIERVDKDLDIYDPTYSTQVTNTAYTEITCSACHDPHNAENPGQLRIMDDVELVDGTVVREGGAGKLCMQCHKSRRGPKTQVAGYLKNKSGRIDPHENSQADVLTGTNGVDYGLDFRKSTHLYAVEDACATCHMQAVPATVDGKANPTFTHAGGHTWNMRWDGGTPDDDADDVEMTGACATCHGPMSTFDIPREDFDGDGKVEGIQTEVEGLLHELGMLLPPDGPTAAANPSYTLRQLNALWNHNLVEIDGSRGIHNPRYVVGLLQASYKNLTGREIGSRTKVRRSLPPKADPRGLVVATLAKPVPITYGLGQNYPNPFNPETEIHYSVPEPVDVQLDIYNALGQRVRTLVSAAHAPGEYAVNWDATDNKGQKLSAGIYFYVMQAGTFVERRKMLLLQ